MGRPRSFDEQSVLETAAGVFVRGGYEGTSIDDLVRALDLHRGSLYQAFGSKRGLFLAVLRHDVEVRLTAALPGGSDLDLLLVAAQERGHRDPEVAILVRQGLDLIEGAADPIDGPRSTPPSEAPLTALRLLGMRLYERLLDPTDSAAEPATVPDTPKEI